MKGSSVRLGVVLLALVVGCGGRVTEEPHDATPDGTPDVPISRDSDPGPPDSPPSATCGDCVSANCKGEYTTCAADAVCKDGIDCLNACPTPDPGNTCANKCISDHSDTKFFDLVSCLAAKCKAPCFPG